MDYLIFCILYKVFFLIFPILAVHIYILQCINIFNKGIFFSSINLLLEYLNVG